MIAAETKGDPDKVKPGDVEFLSFEGGGGKGPLYLAPLIAMTHSSFKVFKTDGNKFVLNNGKIKGIAGASAGAITAAFLACNVPLEMFGNLALNLNPPRYGMTTEFEGKTNIFEAFDDLAFDNNFLYALIPDISNTDNFGFNKRLRTDNLDALVSTLNAAIDFLFTKYGVDNLKNDYGISPGYVIRKYVANVISDNMSSIIRAKVPIPKLPFADFSKDLNITFKKHFELTNVELVLTSVNLNLRQMFYLSYKTTPNLIIADAVRMSMSIPGFFKPVIISSKQLPKESTTLEKAILPGTWVDGGVVNNNPIHAFDVRPDSPTLRTQYYQPGKLNPKLFGMRLGREATNPVDGYKVNSFGKIDSLINFAKQTFNTIIDNSSELQIHQEIDRKNVLDLVTSIKSGKLSELDTYNFVPDQTLLKTLIIKGITDTLSFFNIPVYNDPSMNPSFQSNFSTELKNIAKKIHE